MVTYTIRFYEGSYQYNSIEAVAPESSSDLFTGVLEELNHQYNYRATDKDLWATVKLEGGSEIYRISRLNKGLVEIRNAVDFNTPYKFMPLEAYSLTRIISEKA